MQREFLLRVTLLVNQSGAKVADAPALPLTIRAESANRALELFVSRSDGHLLEHVETGEAVIRASVDIDRKVYGVTVGTP